MSAAKPPAEGNHLRALLRSRRTCGRRTRPSCASAWWAALVLVALAKAANVLVPVMYARAAVDALAPKDGIGAALTVPVALLLAYGVLRVMSSVFAELRNAIFAKVQARAGAARGAGSL